MLEYPGMNRRMSWPSACRYLSRAPDTSARPPALANGVTSAEAKQIFNGIVGSYRSARRPLVKPLLWGHALGGGLPDAPGIARGIDRGGLHCFGLAALVPMGALVRGQLAAEPLIPQSPHSCPPPRTCNSSRNGGVCTLSMVRCRCCDGMRR